MPIGRQRIVFSSLGIRKNSLQNRLQSGLKAAAESSYTKNQNIFGSFSDRRNGRNDSLYLQGLNSPVNVRGVQA